MLTHEALLPRLFLSIEAQLGPGAWPSESLVTPTTFHSPDLSQHCFSPQLPWLRASHPAGLGQLTGIPGKPWGSALGLLLFAWSSAHKRPHGQVRLGSSEIPKDFLPFSIYPFRHSALEAAGSASPDLLPGAASLPGLKEHKRCHSQEGNRKTAAVWKHIFLSCLKGSLSCGLFCTLLIKNSIDHLVQQLTYSSPWKLQKAGAQVPSDLVKFVPLVLTSQ